MYSNFHSFTLRNSKYIYKTFKGGELQLPRSDAASIIFVAWLPSRLLLFPWFKLSCPPVLHQLSLPSVSRIRYTTDKLTAVFSTCNLQFAMSFYCTIIVLCSSADARKKISEGILFLFFFYIFLELQYYLSHKCLRKCSHNDVSYSTS